MEVRFINYQWRNADPIYVSQSYLQSFGEDAGWIAGYIDGEMRLVISYVIKKKYIFKFGIFQSAPIAIADQVSEEDEREFLNGCVSRLAEVGVDCCAQPPPHAVFRVCPDNSIAVPFGSYIVNLDRSEDELWSGIHSKHRNVILNARKKGVEVRFGAIQDIGVVYDLLVRTMSRSNMPFVSRDAFEGLISCLGEQVDVVLACHDGMPLGCAVFPYSQHSAYYQYGGSIDSPILGSMNLLHWEAMKRFRMLGVKRYDFVGARIQPQPGSKLEGIQRFKRRFGATMHVGYLWKMPLRYKYYIYNVLQNLKHRGKGDIIDQERRDKKDSINFRL